MSAALSPALCVMAWGPRIRHRRRPVPLSRQHPRRGVHFRCRTED